MKKRNKIIGVSGIALAAVIVILYMLFSGKTLCTGIDVEIINDSITRIIDEKDIEQIVLNEYKELIGSSIDIVDLASTESKIEEHPTVKNAEVFKRHTGVLSIKIEQRIPIVRIMPRRGLNFYIDKEGSIMPTSKIGSMRVLISNGSIKFDYKKHALTVFQDTLVTQTLNDLYTIASNISEDRFLSAQIEQIFVKENGEYELVPKVGKHIVLLGNVDDCEKKLSHLKHFYIHIMKDEGWRKFSYLNLKYKGQIICTKSKS